MGIYSCNMYISIVDLNAPCSKKTDDVKIIYSMQDAWFAVGWKENFLRSAKVL